MIQKLNINSFNFNISSLRVNILENFQMLLNCAQLLSQTLPKNKNNDPWGPLPGGQGGGRPPDFEENMDFF